MKKTILLTLTALLFSSCGNKPEPLHDEPLSTDTATVYMTRHVTPEALIRIFEALGVEPQGKVAVKISTGEAGGHNYLKPELIGPLVQKVNGTIVECNCAYPGKRDHSDEHWQTIRDHGFLDIAPVDLMDEEGEIRIPVRDTTHLPYNLVGSHLSRYQFMINLAHFKGHQMAGFGGVLKNQSIGVSSANGKALIHTAGKCNSRESQIKMWGTAIASTKQDDFCESMAAAAQSVHDYFKGRIVYIDVMNNLSVDCDCNPNPKQAQIQDVGILASTDPVAVDQACLDIIFNMPTDSLNNPEPLIKRIHKKHGPHTVDHAAKIGLGTKRYKIILID